jgi:hypothetical protein
VYVTTSTDNVGIGTSVPGVKLHSLATTEQLRLSYNPTNYNAFTVGSSGSLTVAATGTNPNITLTPGGTGYTLLNGNVGLGTAVPQALLAVGASGQFQASSTGAVTAATVNKVTITAPAAGSTLTIVDGKTLTANNTIALSAGADSKTLNIGSNNLTFTTTADTNVTLPTTGTLVNSAVTTLSSLTNIGSGLTGVLKAAAGAVTNMTGTGNMAARCSQRMPSPMTGIWQRSSRLWFLASKWTGHCEAVRGGQHLMLS